MIVKDESAIIARCLGRLKPFLDRWVVVDTGSTDRTVEIVGDTLRSLPGRLVTRPWKGFGDAKTAALQLAREEMGGRGYALVMDADEFIDGEIPRALTHEAYAMWMQVNTVRYHGLRLLRLDRNWRYEGVLHEFATCDQPWTHDLLDQVTIRTTRDGARSASLTKYADDARVLEAACRDLKERDPMLGRYTFYLAQSYRDSGDDRRAATAYLLRAAMPPGLCYEEIYVSLLEAARAFRRLGEHVSADVTFVRAHHAWPQRQEALRELSYAFGERLKTSEPTGTLFVESPFSETVTTSTREP